MSESSNDIIAVNCINREIYSYLFSILINSYPRTLNDVESPLRGNDSEDYDPHTHRNVAHPTTYVLPILFHILVLNEYTKFSALQYRDTETLIHLLKGSLGTGILAMPKAFHQSGYLSGLVNTILIGILCTYGLHILVSSITFNYFRKHIISLHDYKH